MHCLLPKLPAAVPSANNVSESKAWCINAEEQEAGLGALQGSHTTSLQIGSLTHAARRA